MAPRNIIDASEDDFLLAQDEVEPVITEATHAQKRPPMKIVWRNVIVYSTFHIGSLYGLWLIPKAKMATLLWLISWYMFCALGITAGVHRLWSHRSYKAKLPLRILLAIMQAGALQNDIIEWARDHRVHHKYSETDGDPHNAKRGFFFSHMGWLLVKKHPEVAAKGKQIDLSDLYKDPVCRLQRRIYKPLVLIVCFVIPTLVPWYMWNEEFYVAAYVNLMRFCVLLHATWMINSVAHMWGMRPYDTRINPRENPTVALSAIGEGFHNYHHVFPQDYCTSEFGWHFNLTTLFIDAAAYLGQAYDRKKIPADIILKRRERTGDRSF